MKVNLTIHIHDEKKLFHVSVNKVGTTAHIEWTNIASHARGLYNRNSQGVCSGIIIAMVNTNYKGWRDVYLKNEFDKESKEYLDKKLEVIQYWEDAGYSNVSTRMQVSNGKSENPFPSTWSNKFNISNMTKIKIYDKITFINISLQLNIPIGLFHRAYYEIVGNRKTVDYPVDDMISLLRFIREDMGLDQTQLKMVA